MPEQEPELTLSKEASAALAGHSVIEMPAPEANQAASQKTGEEAGEAQPVTREQFDQLKAERDQLLDRLARLQAEFDPHHHEALGTVERQDLPDQHVAEEIRRGYKLRDRLLRPALVRIASNPKQTSE